MSAAGRECTAETAERNASGRQRQAAASGELRTNCGETAESAEKLRRDCGRMRNHCTVSLSLMPSEPAPIPCAAPGPLKPGKQRRRVPAVADRAPDDLAPFLVSHLPPKSSRETQPAPAPKAAGSHTLTKRGRAWAVHDPAGELVALVLYRKGAAEVVRRLDSPGHPIGAGSRTR
jgi:hypothetical protein